jgi:hypothetical protein
MASNIDKPPSGLPLCTFPLGNARSTQFQTRMGLPLVMVRQRNIFARGLCYWNVDAMVQRHGGSAVVGWQLLWWPNRMMLAMHHAVWRKPGGTLLDITEKEHADKNPEICFCEDASVAVDLKWPMFVPNKYIVLGEAKIIGHAIQSLEAQLGAARDMVDYVKLHQGVFFPGQGLSLAAGSAFPRQLQRRLHTANRNQRIALERCRGLAVRDEAKLAV